MTSRPFIAAAAALLLATLDAPSPLLAQSAPATTPGKPVMGAFGIDTAQMDTSVKPGDDFFKYVNGKWLATFKIPADKASYGAFDLLNDKAEEDVRTLLAELGKTRPAPGSVGQKVIDLYESWMDEAAIEARGIAPLKADFDAIAAAKSKADITRLMGTHRLHGAVRQLHHPRPRRSDALRGRHLAVRPRHAGARLLPEQGREVRRLPRRLQDLRHPHPRADRRQDAGRERGRDHRARDEDRRGPLAAREAARHPGDQQPDRSRRAGEDDPRRRLGHRARGRRPRQGAELPRQRESRR